MRLPNVPGFILLVFRMVSLGSCPVRLLSFLYVRTSVLIGASLYPDWRFQLVESLLDAYAPFTKLKERQNNVARARKAGIMRARGLELITTPFGWNTYKFINREGKEMPGIVYRERRNLPIPPLQK